MDKRAAKISAPALLHGEFNDLAQGEDGIDILLWSGGKDSFLAARALVREHGGHTSKRLLLLTTFDATSRTVAHQEMPIATIVKQAATLHVPLLGVPLWSHIPYEERVGEALRLVGSKCKVSRVCNGDLHLESVKQWRDARLSGAIDGIGATSYAPLWKVPYEELLADLARSGTPCEVCAIGDENCWSGKPPCVTIGERFDASLAERVGQEGADRFGENGEFHTLAKVWAADCVAHPLCSSADAAGD